MKRIAFALGFAGVALISYAGFRGAKTRHKVSYYIQDDAYAGTSASTNINSADEPVADEVTPDRAEASMPATTAAAAPAPAQPPGGRLQAEVDYEQAVACFNKSDVPCQGYDLTSYHDYQVDVLTHMQAIAENEYLAMLKDPSLKTLEHENFARELLVSPQQEMQLIGIKMLQLFDPSEENFNAISNCVGGTLSDQLLEQGMIVLNGKYGNNSDYADKIRATLERQIQYGIDEDTAYEAAQELYQYLDKSNFRHYLALEQKLVPFKDRSFKNRYSELHSVLSEYAASNHYEP